MTCTCVDIPRPDCCYCGWYDSLQKPERQVTTCPSGHTVQQLGVTLCRPSCTYFFCWECFPEGGQVSDGFTVHHDQCPKGKEPVE